MNFYKEKIKNQQKKMMLIIYINLLSKHKKKQKKRLKENIKSRVYEAHSIKL